jgi:ATP-dependent DNA helicase RecG
MKENRSYEIKEIITNTFLKTVCAYANYGDGIIQFGITDDGTVTGIENPNKACLNIENRINDSIVPVPDYSLSVDEDTNVITLTVKEGESKPYFYRSKAYRRSDTATVEVDRVELNRLIREGENYSYDEMSSKEQTFSFHILEDKMKGYLHISALTPDILKSIGIINNKGKYTNAGALLADRNDFTGIDCAKFGETLDVILDREIFDHKSILQQYDDALSLYRKYYQYDKIEGAVRKTIELVPEKAFRETIANALVHRAWDVKAQIRVAMYDDRIEVFTPGGLPEEITPDEYLHGQLSVLRNPVIANVFFRLNLIESFGTGIQRIDNAYRDSDVKPNHLFTENAIKVILPVVKTIKELSEEEYVIFKNTNQIGKSSTDIAKAAGYGKNKTLAILHTLIHKGYLEKFGNGRGTRYRIK